jgi:glycine dehydrogenase
MSEMLTAPADRQPQPSSDEARAFAWSDRFVRRHIGPDAVQTRQMLELCGFESLDAVADAAVPAQIRLRKPLNLPASRSEYGLLGELKQVASKNQVFRSFIGAGYHDCITPPVIQRNILENPGWYTQYTPYQAEISQGRLEALLNFQTMIIDLTGMEIANASLLDEGTAAAEAMAMCWHVKDGKGAMFVSDACHPQTIHVVQTRAKALGIKVIVGPSHELRFPRAGFRGARAVSRDRRHRLRLPRLSRARSRTRRAGHLSRPTRSPSRCSPLRANSGRTSSSATRQRFGVPMGYGGPHAAYFATKDIYKRQMPGRIVGVSKDAQGRPRCASRCRRVSNISAARKPRAISALPRCSWR